jgi:hypothetical protein
MHAEGKRKKEGLQRVDTLAKRPTSNENEKE